MTVRFVHGKSVKKIGVQLENEKLGKKWICPTTGKKFYDLNKEPVTSPYTGELLEVTNTENLEKEKTEEVILETDDKETSQVSETDAPIAAHESARFRGRAPASRGGRRQLAPPCVGVCKT